jgi:putative tryptophan/tyrosine transport system substrate-binding protein
MKFDQLKRRDFITLLSGAAAWPIVARAQPTRAIRRVGVLMAIAESDPEGQARVRAFDHAMNDLGWVEGRNVRIDVRWAAGNADRFRAYAAELVALAPDVIVANSNIALSAVQQEATTIPIVFFVGVDPIDSGFVTNLARPGGNITGFTTFEPEMGGKLLGLLKEIASRVTRVAVILNPATAAPHTDSYFKSINPAARALAVEAIATPVHDIAELERAVAVVAREPGGGLVVMPDSFTATHRNEIISLGLRHSIPAIYAFRFFPTNGGLLSYGVSLVDLFRRSASYVDRILNGSKAGDLPVQQPTKFELVINLKTARALSLNVPPTLLARADEVIE